MATVRILSAGAAQAVVERIAVAFGQESGHGVEAKFGAVGAMKASVFAGEPADVIILTGALIDELITQGHVVSGSRVDLGAVGTGVAVRKGTPLPDISGEETLRGNLLAATNIACPDPAIATAGKVVMRGLERLGIAGQVEPRLHFFPNGYAAMKWLAESRGSRELGITQITEILANKGVTYAGPLPGELQVKTVYSAGLASRAESIEAAKAFIARLVAPLSRPALAQAGFETGN